MFHVLHYILAGVDINIILRRMNIGLDNANPVVYECTKDRDIRPEDEDDDVTDKIDEREVFGK